MDARAQPRSSLALRPRRAPQGGFTLVETVVGLAVLLVSLLALSTTSLVVHSLERSDHERRQATDGLRSMTEHMFSFSQTARSAESWSRAVVDAYAQGAVPGDRFDVEGLDPWDGLAAVGTVQVITDERLSDEDLGVELGMPRDLDNDGLAATADVSDAANLLPVVLRLRWRGEAGEREVTQGFYLMGW